MEWGEQEAAGAAASGRDLCSRSPGCTQGHRRQPEDLREALEAQRLHKSVFWGRDALGHGTAIWMQDFMTEDLQDGRTLGSINFRSPFKMSAAELGGL